MLQDIAKFLNLEDVTSYTGHSFRRSSATILANAGGDLLTLKCHSGWKSSTVAKGYIDDSILHKKNTEQLISAIIDDNQSLDANNGTDTESLNGDQNMNDTSINNSTDINTGNSICSPTITSTIMASEKMLKHFTFNNCQTVTINFSS